MIKLGQIIKNLHHLSQTIGTQELYNNLSKEVKLKKSKQVQGDNILIMATHPGEEVFACGGIIKKYTRAGKKVYILYFCDGSMGNSSGIRDSSLVIKRKKETREAAKILEIKEGSLIFWGYKDQKLAVHTANIKALINLLQNIKPEAVFIPSLFENNHDSRAVHDIFADVINIYSSKLEYFTIWMYEFLNPLVPNFLIDISDQLKFKNLAMKCFTSQLQIKNYHHAMLGLNSYRSQIAGLNGFCEAFFSCNTNLYLKLYGLVNKK